MQHTNKSERLSSPLPSKVPKSLVLSSRTRNNRCFHSAQCVTMVRYDIRSARATNGRIPITRSDNHECVSRLNIYIFIYSHRFPVSGIVCITCPKTFSSADEPYKFLWRLPTAHPFSPPFNDTMIYNHFGANPFGFQHTARVYRPTSARVILTVKCFLLR